MEAETRTRIDEDVDSCSSYLQKFKLYETHSNFYMIGRDKSRSSWRLLKIDRSEPSELNFLEDPTTYTEYECCELLKRIDEGSLSTGGLKFVTTCYGIIGFIKFLGPHYMLVITKRRKIGFICGHAIYSISKSEMISIPNSDVKSSTTFTKIDNRYKKLLCAVDLTKDFFFSYSYNVMQSLQKNLYNYESGPVLYETMFVWNEYLTRGIRNYLKNTLWTVALVYGFFKQVKLSASGRDFMLTLIARRSRHYAGTRYLKRGINEKGRVANDVETEQIVFEDVLEGCPVQISSIVQDRGSIPLFWSQQSSRLNLKPDIILSKKDPKYEATKFHFENLVKRYGNPIIILNLIKAHERKPRESILRAEFANAIRCINKNLPEENHLRFLHWDLHKHFRNKATSVLALLMKVGEFAVNLTGTFYCQVPANLKMDGSLIASYFENSDCGDCSSCQFSNNSDDGDSLESEVSSIGSIAKVKLPVFQKGVLRTNCIDCLDRTNVAQYAYGLVALGRQLHTLGLVESENIDLDNPLAEDLMSIYETMGDTLALQCGGSAAHNKIFSERRGHWKPATQSQEFFRTLQRYYSNAYVDAEKQDAINVFLGYFQPQQGKPALWELHSEQHHHVRMQAHGHADENARSFMKRSFSDGNILSKNDSPLATKNLVPEQSLSARSQRANKCLSESKPAIACDSEASDHRFSYQLDQYLEGDYICHDSHGNSCSCSNFLDMDQLSSSGNSCEDVCERSSSITGTSLDGVNGLKVELTRSGSKVGSSMKGKEHEAVPDDPLAEYSDNFIRWVNHGVMFN